MEAMSWAPFFHPSGDYLIFATNKHGFGNFELYMVDRAGKQEPSASAIARLRWFTSLSSNGKTLVWTSNNGGSQSQLFEGKWNDAAARELLKLPPGWRQDSQQSSRRGYFGRRPGCSRSLARQRGQHRPSRCRPSRRLFVPTRIGWSINRYRRRTQSTAYVAAYLESLGLQPAGENGTFFQEFEFVSNVKLGEKNALTLGDTNYKVDKQWRPLFFAQDGHVDPTDVVFAGYGIVAPKSDTQEAYDSYGDLDVKDKWVLVYRFLPQDITPERRQHLSAYSVPRYKAMTARERGAKGLIIVSGPTSSVRQQLVPLAMDGTLGTTSLAVISVSDEVAGSWLAKCGKDLAKLQKELDTGAASSGLLSKVSNWGATLTSNRSPAAGGMFSPCYQRPNPRNCHRPILIINRMIWL